MKKVVIFIIAYFLFMVSAYAEMNIEFRGGKYSASGKQEVTLPDVNNVTAGTVTGNYIAANVITFNTTINKLLVINGSSETDALVTFALTLNSNGSYGAPTEFPPAFRLKSGSSVSLDVNTRAIGYIWDKGGSGYLYYLATSNNGVQP